MRLVSPFLIFQQNREGDRINIIIHWVRNKESLAELASSSLSLSLLRLILISIIVTPVMIIIPAAIPMMIKIS